MNSIDSSCIIISLNLKPFTRSTYHSNAIKGNTLTYAETYAILYNDNSFKIQGKEPIEIYAAINHKKALDVIFENLKINEEIGDNNKIENSNLIENVDIKLEVKEKNGFLKQVFVNIMSNLLWKILGILFWFGLLAILVMSTYNH